MTTLPTQQEMFERALAQVEAARTALSQARSWLAADWDGIEVGVELPRAVGEHRTRTRAAITAARTEIDTARDELTAALEIYAPPVQDWALDEPDAAAGDYQGER